MPLLLKRRSPINSVKFKLNHTKHITTNCTLKVHSVQRLNMRVKIYRTLPTDLKGKGL